VLNLIQLVVLGWIFWVLVQGTTANSTILSTYTGAVIGIVFLLSSAVIGLTASDRKERERLGITTMTGMFCEAGLIIFGQLAIGSILVMGWFSIFVMYCLLR
jgi:dolichol kinase